MIGFVRAAGLSAALFLGGCGAYQAITFKSSENSFVRKGELISLAVVGMPGRLTGDVDAENVKLNIPEAGRDRVAKQCGIEDSRSRAESAVLAGLAVMAVGVLIDAGIAKLNEYAEQKAKEFKHTYSARANVGEFYLPRNNASGRATPRTRCILFQRTVTGTDGVSAAPAMTLVLQFQVLSDRAYVLKPIYLDLSYAGARTSAEGKAIDLDVAVGIAVVKRGQGTALVSELVTQQNYPLRKISIGGDPLSNDAKLQSGTVIPAFDSTTSATVVVAVTETGDGADTFGQLKKDSDAYGKVLKDLGLEQLKTLLGAQ